MTKADQKAESKARYNSFLAGCPSRQLLDRISDKWVTLILTALGSGPECTGDPRAMRYSELARTLAGVSPKMLTQTLRSLELDGLISRTATPTVPVTVTYELTDLGLSLLGMIRGLKSWAETHMDEVRANRKSGDAAPALAR